MNQNLSNPFRFDVEKATQAVGVILREEPGHRINSMKLLKLLEIAERESLKETGRMITGDRFVAMDRGPLLGGVYNLIKGEHLEAAHWDSYIDRERYHVSLGTHPGVSRLSPSEIAKLSDVTKRHSNDDEWDMVEITHKFGEWTKNKPPKGSSAIIPISDVLSAVGVGYEDAKAILEEAATQRRIDTFFTRNKAWGRKTRSQSQTSTTTSMS